MPKKITKDFVAHQAWKEFLNKDNPALLRMRWFDRFCNLRNLYPNPIPLRDGPSEFRTSKTRDEFDAEMDKLLRGGANANKLPASEPERCEGIRESVGPQGSEDDFR